VPRLAGRRDGAPARSRAKAPLAVAAILAAPLFFAALMAMSLAVEKPTVHHVLRHGTSVVRLGDPAGSTEAAVWLLALVPPLAVVLVGAAAMLLGRAGVAVSSLAGIAAAVVLLVPLDGWTSRHTGRYPEGVDLIPTSAGSENIYLRGEWEGTARHTVEQLGIVTIALAAIAIAFAAVVAVRRRRGVAPPPPPPPPPELATAESQIVRAGLGRFRSR
jgi:hypothetical protein